MKKVLVATCVMAMTAFGITNASADPVSSARGNAFGINLSLLGEDILDREPEVTSVLGDGLVSDDVITPEVEPVTVAGTGVVVANTSVESNIIPFTFDGGEALRGGDGESGSGDDLLGGIFDDLLGGGGGDDGGGGGGDDLLGGILGGGGGDGGDGGGSILGLNEGDATTVEAQQLDGLTGGGGDGGDEGLLGGDLLGGLLDGGDEGSEEIGADDEIIIPAVNALGFARIEDLNLVTEDGGNSVLGPLDNLEAEVKSLLIEALLEVEAVTAEAVAVCVDNQVFFDTSSNILSVDNEPVSLIDDLTEAVSDITEDLGLLEIATNEVGVTDDGNGVFVNALRITLLDDTLGGTGDGTGDGGGDGLLGGLLGDDGGDGGDTTGGATDGVTGGATDGVTGGATDGVTGGVTAQQLGGDDNGDGSGDDSALELIVGHAEVSGTVCAAQAPPAGDVDPLPSAGDGRTLPVTGGGLGVLPSILALGLTGGALAAGRVALRARREHTL
jgi:hypothetical protein